MGDAILWLIVAGIAVLPAYLCRNALFWLAGLIPLVWLGAAIWAWNIATDSRHLDYALTADGGDPGMIFAVGTVFFGLPIYLTGALVGCALYQRKRIVPSNPLGSEGTEI